MVADTIIRHRLDDDSKDPELVQAIKESAGTLYAGDRSCWNVFLKANGIPSFRRDGSFHRSIIAHRE